MTLLRFSCDNSYLTIVIAQFEENSSAAFLYVCVRVCVCTRVELAHTYSSWMRVFAGINCKLFRSLIPVDLCTRSSTDSKTDSNALFKNRRRIFVKLYVCISFRVFVSLSRYSRVITFIRGIFRWEKSPKKFSLIHRVVAINLIFFCE